MSTLRKSFKTKSDAIKISILDTNIELKNCNPPPGYRFQSTNVGSHRGSSSLNNSAILKDLINRGNERENIRLVDNNQSQGFLVWKLHVRKKKSDDEWIATLELNSDSDSYEQMKTSLKTQGWGSI